MAADHPRSLLERGRDGLGAVRSGAKTNYALGKVPLEPQMEATGVVFKADPDPKHRASACKASHFYSNHQEKKKTQVTNSGTYSLTDEVSLILLTIFRVFSPQPPLSFDHWTDLLQTTSWPPHSLLPPRIRNRHSFPGKLLPNSALQEPYYIFFFSFLPFPQIKGTTKKQTNDVKCHGLRQKKRTSTLKLP